jgi:hypothetical protein
VAYGVLITCDHFALRSVYWCSGGIRGFGAFVCFQGDVRDEYLATVTINY